MRKPSWIQRLLEVRLAGMRVDETTPKVGRLVKSRFGFRKIGWLKALKRSAEISKPYFSRNLVSFPISMSKLRMPKPRSGRLLPVCPSDARRIGRKSFKAAEGSLK